MRFPTQVARVHADNETNARQVAIDDSRFRSSSLEPA
jgi:hypothetical protein